MSVSSIMLLPIVKQNGCVRRFDAVGLMSRSYKRLLKLRDLSTGTYLF